MIVSPASRIDSAISFGVFWRFAPSTSAIIRSRNVSPGLCGDPHDDLVGEHARPARHRGTVATRLPDDGADSPVIADSSTVAMPSTTSPSDGIDLAGRDDAVVADLERAGRDLLERPVRLVAPVRHRLGPRLAERRGLRLAAAFGHRLGEVGEEHGRPQEERDQDR